MGQVKFTRAVNAIKALSRKDRQRVREMLDAWLKAPGEPLTERECTWQMLRDGILDQVSQEMDPAARRNFKPVEVLGKPVSETIIEERR